LLCQLSLGAMNTAVAVLDAIVTRFENPFLVDLQLSGRYGSPAEAQDIRTRAKVFAQREGAEAPIIAVHAFALWVLGEPEEAIRAAGAIRARFPDSSYAKWPDQMRSARAARTIEPQP